MTTGYLVIGPRRHGVTMLARQLAAARPLSPIIDVNHCEDVRAKMGRFAHVEAWHVHYTDQLFGARCELAAAAFEYLVADVQAQSGASVSVTLHDLPLADDDPARFARRAAAYRRVVDAATGAVIVNSEYEAAQLARFSTRSADVIVPLPIDLLPLNEQPGATPTDGPVDIALFGFVYPDKGHQQAIDAAAVLGRPTRVVALGDVAAGHEQLAIDLALRAERAEVGFVVDGFVPDVALTARLQAAHIPLAANQRVSASASIGSWIGAGRRPLVRDSPFVRELAERCPGTVTIYPDGDRGLADALRQAVDDPESTWLGPNATAGPSTADAAEQLDAVLGRLVGREPA